MDKEAMLAGYMRKQAIDKEALSPEFVTRVAPKILARHMAQAAKADRAAYKALIPRMKRTGSKLQDAAYKLPKGHRLPDGTPMTRQQQANLIDTGFSALSGDTSQLRNLLEIVNKGT